MSDDAIREAESALKGKIEELSNALSKDKDTPAEPTEASKKQIIPEVPSLYKREQIEAILMVGGDSLRDKLNKATGIEFKKAAPAAKAAEPAAKVAESIAEAKPVQGINKVSMEEIDKAISEQTKKIGYLEQFKKFRQRYEGMTDEEIKDDLEFGMKYFKFLEGRSK